MSKIAGYYLVAPDDWLFGTHGDVLDGKARARAWLAEHGSYEGAEEAIEEFVRQWALKQVLVAYGYPEGNRSVGLPKGAEEETAGGA